MVGDEPKRRRNMIWFLPLLWPPMFAAAFARSIGKHEPAGTAVISGLGAVGLVTIVGVVIAEVVPSLVGVEVVVLLLMPACW
jgi:hypothetical protein